MTSRLKLNPTTPLARPKPDLGQPPPPARPSTLQIWENHPPDNVKPLSTGLGVPDFFPFTVSAPEERMNSTTIENGFTDPYPFHPPAEEFESLRTRFFNNPQQLQELKSGILNSLRNISWKKQNRNAREQRPASQQKKKVLFPSLTQVGNIPEAVKKFPRELATTREPLGQLKVPQGFTLENLLKALSESRVPLIRATWFIRVFHLNKFYSHLSGHATISAPTTKSSKEASTHWTKLLWASLNTQLSEFFGKLSQRNKDRNRNSMDKNKYSLSMLTRLLAWTYYENLIVPDQLFDYFFDTLRQSANNPEQEAMLLSIVMPFVADICLNQRALRKMKDYCLPRFEALSKAAIFVVLPAIVAKILSAVTAILRAVVAFAPDYLIATETPEDFYTKLYNVPKLLACQVAKMNAQPANGGATSLDSMFMLQVDELKKKESFLRQVLIVQSSAWPMVVSGLEEFQSSLDFEGIANSLFALPPRSKIAEIPTAVVVDGNMKDRVQIAVGVLFQWCFHPLRQQPAQPFVVAAILDKVRTFHPEVFGEVQATLLKVLDCCMELDPADMEHLCLVYAELIRRNLFSHSRYVRSLVSRGLLETPTSTKAERHRRLLEQLPLPPKSSSQERSQRTIALYGFSASNSDVAMLPQIAEAVEKFLQMPADRLASFVSSLTIFHRASFAEKLTDLLKATVNNPNCTLQHTYHLTEEVLLCLESHQDLLAVLVELISWLLRSKLADGLAPLLLHYIYSYHKLWFCRDRLIDLLDGLQQLFASLPGSGVDVLVKHICSVYESVDSIQLWKLVYLTGKLKQQFSGDRMDVESPSLAPAFDKAALLEGLAAIKSPGTEEWWPLASVEALTTGQFTIRRLADEIISTVKRLLVNPSTKSSEVFQAFGRVIHLTRRLAQIPFHDFENSLLQALHLLFIESKSLFATSEQRVRVVLELLVALVSAKCLLWSSVVKLVVRFSSDLVTQLESAMEGIGGVGEASVNQPLADWLWLLVLLDWTHLAPLLFPDAMNHDATLFPRAFRTRTELSSPLCSDLTVPDVVHHYKVYIYTLEAAIESISALAGAKIVKVDSPSSSPLSVTVWSFPTPDLMRLFVQSTRSASIVLKSPHKESAWLGVSLQCLGLARAVPADPREDLAQFAAQLLKILGEVDDWTVNRTAVKVQMLLDHFQALYAPTPSPEGYTPPFPISSYTIFAPLLALVAILRREKENFLERLLTLLDPATTVRAFLLEAVEWISMPQVLANEISLIEGIGLRLMNYGIDMPCDFKQIASRSGNFGNVMLQWMTLALVKSATSEDLRKTLAALALQFKALLPTNTESVQWHELRNHLKVRVVMLYRLLRFHRPSPDSASGALNYVSTIKDQAPQISGLLLQFLASPVVQSCLDQFDLWTLTLHTLSTVIWEPSESELSWSQAARRVLTELDATLKFPAKLRWRIEQVLPFLERREQVTFNANSSRLVAVPNVDPWLMLEDADDSLVLKAFNPKFVERKEMTYAETDKQMPESSSNVSAAATAPPAAPHSRTPVAATPPAPPTQKSAPQRQMPSHMTPHGGYGLPPPPSYGYQPPPMNHTQPGPAHHPGIPMHHQHPQPPPPSRITFQSQPPNFPQGSAASLGYGRPPPPPQSYPPITHDNNPYFTSDNPLMSGASKRRRMDTPPGPGQPWPPPGYGQGPPPGMPPQDQHPPGYGQPPPHYPYK